MKCSICNIEFEPEDPAGEFDDICEACKDTLEELTNGKEEA